MKKSILKRDPISRLKPSFEEVENHLRKGLLRKGIPRVKEPIPKE